MNTTENSNNQTNQLLKPRKKSRWWIWAILVIVVIGGIIGYSQYNQPKKSPYITELAVKKDITQSVDVTGTIKAAADIKLNFKSVGNIQTVNVKVNDNVTKGQVLASLDTSELNSQLRQSQANVAVAEAQLRQTKEGTRPEEIKIQETNVQNAQNNYDSAKKNYDLTKITIDSDLQTSQVNLETAQKSLVSAQKNLQNIQDQSTQNLKNSIDSILNQVNIILISEATVQNNIEEIYNNNSWYNTFRDMDFSLLNSSENLRAQTAILQASASSSYQTALASKSETDTQDAITKTINYLNNITGILTNTDNFIYQENAKVFFSATDLTNLKSRQSSNDGTNNGNLTSAQGLTNSISNTKINNQIAVDNANSQITNYENQVKTAQESINKINANTSSTLQKALDAVNTARDQLSIQNNQLELKKAGPTSAAIAIAQAQVDQANAAVNTIQTQINNQTIIAPTNGIITQVNANSGEQSNSANPIIQMQSNAKYEINADIAETDIDKIKINDTTKITFDAFTKEDQFTGTVVSIDPAATIIQGVVYYKTKVILDTTNDRIKPGMTANIEIITAEEKDVLAVPNQAVKTKNGQKYVEVLVDEASDKVEEKIVTTTLRGNTYTQITSGLKGGEKIIILKQ